MNNVFRTFWLRAVYAVFGLALLAPAIAGETDENLERVREKIAEVFEVIEPQHVDVSPVDGWYKIQKGSIVAYISEDGRYLLQGDMIDLEAQVNLSELARDEGRREIMAEVGAGQVISFAPEDVRHSVTVFTDTGCTYCRRLHNQIDDYLALGIEVRYMLYPRNGPASREWNTAEEVWCAANRNEALTAAKLDRSFETESCDASIIEEHYMLGQEIGLSGTPAIVFEDGTLISGYLPPDALIQRLEQAGAQASR